MQRVAKPLFPKSRCFYDRDASVKNPDIVFTVDPERHQPQRRSLSHAFSAKALREAEGTIQRYIRLFTHQISQRGNPETGGVDMSTVFNWLTFDIIGKICQPALNQCQLCADHNNTDRY